MSCLPRSRFTTGRQHQLIEQFSIEKLWVRLTGPGSIPRLLGIARNRDLFPHLEAHLKVFWDLAQIAPELVCARRSVERRVVPHGPKQRLTLVLILAILPEAFPIKRALGILPCVDLTLPAFIRPSCGGTETGSKERGIGPYWGNCTVSPVASSTVRFCCRWGQLWRSRAAEPRPRPLHPRSQYS
jgi:hypothetical protein